MLIICNGMQRSGSTLQYNWVVALAEMKNVGINEGFFTVTDFLNKLENIQTWVNDEVFHIIKAHDFLPICKLNYQNDKIKIIYIYRDLRDVALSLKIKYAASDKNILQTIDRMVEIYDKIKKHPYSLIQCYEEVIENKAKAISEIIKFLNMELNYEAIQKVLKGTDIQEIQKKIKRMPIRYKIGQTINNLFKRLPYALKRLPRRIGFVAFFRRHVVPYNITHKDSQFHMNHISKNKGKPGQWRIQLDQNLIQFLNTRYKSWFTQNQYPVNE